MTPSQKVFGWVLKITSAVSITLLIWGYYVYVPQKIDATKTSVQNEVRQNLINVAVAQRELDTQKNGTQNYMVATQVLLDKKSTLATSLNWSGFETKTKRWTIRETLPSQKASPEGYPGLFEDWAEY